MSLINQMLRDLDARQGGSAAAAGATQTVRTPAGKLPRWTVLALALLAAAAGLAFWLLHRHGTAAGVAVPPAAAAYVHGPASGPPSRGAPAAAATATQAPAGTPVSQLSAVIAGSDHTLILTFSPPLRAAVLAGPAPSIRAAIPADARLAALGSPPHLQGLQAFRLVPAPGGLVLLAHAAPGYAVRLGPAANAAPLGAALALDVIAPATAAAPAATPASAPTGPAQPPAHARLRARTRPGAHAGAAAPVPGSAAATPGAAATEQFQPVPETPAQRAAHDYDLAVKALRGGDSDSGESLLRKALAARPGYIDARLLLAGVLVRAGRRSDALQLLASGIANGGADIYRLAMLQAHLLAGSGDLTAAIAALQRSAPPLRTATDYHAQLAAYEEQAGQYAEAAAEYRALVALVPGDARLWLGLAIALDQLGKPGAAAAYRRALDAGGLPPKAGTYAHQRLQALAGPS